MALTASMASGAGAARGMGAAMISASMGARGMMSAFLPFLAIGGFVALMRGGEMFNRGMRTSLAIMGEVSDAMQGRMRTAAIETAKITAHSAEEMARAYFFLASAGMTAVQSIVALPAVARFARAGMFDLSRATELATDAQHALGMGLKNPIKNLKALTRIMDVLVKANTLADATTEQFAEALTNKAGAAFKVVKKEVEEAVAVLAALAMAGRKGEEAGTQLSRVMIGLKANAINNAAAFKRLGIRVFDASDDMRNMADIVEDMERALGGMTDKGQQAAIMALGFTKKTSDLVALLIGMSDEIRRFEGELDRAGGTMKEVADKQLTPLQEGWAKLRAGFTDAGGAIMDLAGGPLGDLAQAMGEAIAMAKEAVGVFGDLNNAIKELIPGEDLPGLKMDARPGALTTTVRMLKLSALKNIELIGRFAFGQDTRKFRAAHIDPLVSGWEDEMVDALEKMGLRIPSLPEVVAKRQAERGGAAFAALSQTIDDGVQEMIDQWQTKVGNIGKAPLKIELETILAGIPKFAPEFGDLRQQVLGLYDALSQESRAAQDWSSVWNPAAEATNRATQVLKSWREELRLAGLEGRERTLEELAGALENVDVSQLRRVGHALDVSDATNRIAELTKTLRILRGELTEDQLELERFAKAGIGKEQLARIGDLQKQIALAREGPGPRFAGALVAGTREAFSARLRMTGRESQQKKLEESSKRRERLQERMANSLDRIDRAVSSQEEIDIPA
jgi:TP901 family phage tail tape measure protein